MSQQLTIGAVDFVPEPARWRASNLRLVDAPRKATGGELRPAARTFSSSDFRQNFDEVDSQYGREVVSSMQNRQREKPLEWSMSSESQPKPADYGLDAEVTRFFSSRIDPIKHLPVLLSWVSFLTLWFLFPPTRQTFRNSLLVWPIIFLYALPGISFGWAINRLRVAYLDFLKRGHKQYPKWQEYQAAYAQWYKLYVKEETERRARQQLIRQQQDKELRQKVSWWKSLDGRTFEKECAGLLKRFGYSTNLTSYSADGGVDILVSDGTKKIVVQCKAHNSYISPSVVRELYGTMIHEKADEGWLITTSGFYSGSRAFAHGKPIKLITIQELLKKASP
jgi:hypothetical protein